MITGEKKKVLTQICYGYGYVNGEEDGKGVMVMANVMVMVKKLERELVLWL